MAEKLAGRVGELGGGREVVEAGALAAGEEMKHDFDGDDNWQRRSDLVCQWICSM